MKRTILMVIGVCLLSGCLSSKSQLEVGQAAQKNDSVMPVLLETPSSIKYGKSYFSRQGNKVYFSERPLKADAESSSTGLL